MSSDSFKTTFSLLWPAHRPRPEHPSLLLSPRTIQDLGLDSLIAKLTGNAPERHAFEQVLLHATADPEVIRYRQDILEDVRTHPELANGLRELLPVIESLTAHYYQRGVLYEKTKLYEVTWRLGELESIVTCVHTLRTLLDPAARGLQAAGWRRLYAVVEEIASDHAFQQMEKELPELLESVRQTRSVTIGINLDHNLLPVQATLLSVNKRPFQGAGFLDKLFNRTGDEQRGVASLHDLISSAASRMPTSPLVPSAQQEISPLMVPLFRDLGDVLNKVSQAVNEVLTEYKRVHGRLFADLWPELIFYLTAARMIERVAALNLPLCRPEIRPVAERCVVVTEHYNLNLAFQLAVGYEEVDLSERVVTHSLQMETEGRIQILTGPNGGGKTTYLQAVGLTQLLAQAGLFIPGRAGRISPVTQLATHFPVEEKLEHGTGRFGEEARRLAEIFNEVNAHSLLLLNESLASTNAGESLYLAADLVRLMRQVGLRAVFATHLHELAAMAPQINAEIGGHSRVISMVASRIELDDLEENDQSAADQALQRSFCIIPGPPLGHSYARQLAAKYGISYEQLRARMRSRGIL